MTVQTSDTSDQVLSEEACFRRMEPRKYGHSETVTNSISPRKRTHYSYPKSTLFVREGYFKQA